MALFDGVGWRGRRRPVGQRTGWTCGSTGAGPASLEDRADPEAAGSRPAGGSDPILLVPEAGGMDMLDPAGVEADRNQPIRCAGDDDARAAAGPPVQPRARSPTSNSGGSSNVVEGGTEHS